MKQRIQKRRIQRNSSTLFHDETSTSSEKMQLWKLNRVIVSCCSFLLLLLEFITPQATTAFQCSPRIQQHYRLPPTTCHSTKDEAELEPSSLDIVSPQSIIDHELEQQINLGLQRAKEVLEKSKAKMAAKKPAEPEQVVEKEHQQHVPFFASKVSYSIASGENAVGSNTASTSSVAATAVATIQQSEAKANIGSSDNDVESRKVKSRNTDTGLIMCDGELMAQISEVEPWEYRSLYEIFTNDAAVSPEDDVPSDVMASIQNLRKVLKTEDYRAIFDVRNRFIGEDN